MVAKSVIEKLQWNRNLSSDNLKAQMAEMTQKIKDLNTEIERLKRQERPR